MTTPINFAITNQCEFGQDCAAPGLAHLKPIPIQAPVPASPKFPVYIEIDWEKQMDDLKRRDEERKNAIAQNAWIQEYRTKMFKNVLNGK